MDKLENYQNIIKEILNEYAEISNSADTEAKTTTVFDELNHRYLLLTYGRENKKRIHSCWVDVEITNEKFYIHFDGTEDGIASELLKKDVPKSDIVLAFKSPEMRKYTDFALT